MTQEKDIAAFWRLWKSDFLWDPKPLCIGRMWVIYDGWFNAVNKGNCKRMPVRWPES